MKFYGRAVSGGRAIIMGMSKDAVLPGGALSTHVRARLWLVNAAQDGWIGIGRVQLLQAIEQTGSIRQAAQRLGMSYKRAWSLVEAMNALGPEPMVVKEAGGRRGGGAVLTDYGRSTLQLYARLSARMQAAAAEMEEEIAAWARGQWKEVHLDD
jgi:molybdate transport system regulatory protein